MLATGSYKEIRLWDVATGRLLRTLSSPTLGVNSVAFDGQTLASGSYDGTILLWELKSESEQ
jgi:WD40 repeat protein